MHIREYATEDCQSVVALSLRAWEPIFTTLRTILGPELDERMHGPDWRTYQGNSVEQTIGAAENHTWVAEHGGAVAGFVTVHLHDDGILGEIYMLAVDPDAQRAGLGFALTEHAVAWIKGQGYPVAMVATGGDPAHARARATYEKAGFTPLPNVQYFKALG
jgi:ribosomal protein S18 acetylase RimI-like enzyme